MIIVKDDETTLTSKKMLTTQLEMKDLENLKYFLIWRFLF